MDKAIEYVEKLNTFVDTLNKENQKSTGDMWVIESGRKFDRVFLKTPNQRLGRYFVDRNSWVIYGIKSWAQVNPRREFGTLDTVPQFDWSNYTGVPRAGTDAEKSYQAREATIAKSYKKRGRPRKN